MQKDVFQKHQIDKNCINDEIKQLKYELSELKNQKKSDKFEIEDLLRNA